MGRMFWMKSSQTLDAILIYFRWKVSQTNRVKAWCRSLDTHTHAGMNVEAALCCVILSWSQDIDVPGQHMSTQLIRYCKSVWEASKPKEAEKPKIETKTEKPETVDKRQKDRAGQGREWHAIFCVQKTGTSAGGKNWCQHNGAHWSVLEHLGSQTETNNSNRFG